MRIGDVSGEMKLNEPRRYESNIGRYKSCQQAQHTKLYSDLSQAYKEGTFARLGLPPGGGGGGP